MVERAMEECRRSLALCERRQAKKLFELLAGLLVCCRHEREHLCGELGVLCEVASHRANGNVNVITVAAAALERRLGIHAPSGPGVARNLATVGVRVENRTGAVFVG